MRSAARILRKPKTRSGSPTWVRPGVFSFDDFFSLVQDGEKADLIDGVIYMASPDNTDNADLQVWLVRLLAEFLDIYQLGTLFSSRVAFRLSDKDSPEPDIAVVLNEQRTNIKRGRVEGPPALAVEVVSPDSVHRDYVVKRTLYEQAGVQEYWIIDPDETRATFLYQRGQRLVEGKPLKHIWHSKVLPAFTLDVRHLWASPRPRIFDLLRDHYYPKPGRA